MARIEPDVPQWTLGDRLRKARETRGIGVQEMAGIMLRDRNTITNYERDRSRPTRRVLTRWAEVTETPLGWLLGDSSPYSPTPPPRRSRKPKNGWFTADELRPTLVAA